MKDFVAARIESPAFDPGLVHIAELTGTEHVSRLFEFQLRLATLEGGIDEEALMTQPATLVFERRSSEGAAPVELRRITGMVRAVRDRALSESKHREYIVTFVPRAWKATLSKTSDVCMDLNVPDIIKQKLGEVGMDEAKDVIFRVRQSHAPREFVVQYQESHWDFICRLAEDLGIHFSIEQTDDRDVLVFGDDNSAFTPSEPASSPFRERGDDVDVFELEARRELVSKTFVARDYNYRNPSMEVLGEAQNGVLGDGKVDEFGPHAKTPAEATYYAKVRSEEAAARSFTFEGKSDLPGLRAGSRLTVEGHPRGDIEMIVTEVVHDLVQPVFGLMTGRERPYRNTFRGLPKSVPYRPERRTPKPVVHGVVTGLVESASATKMGAIDDQGRYRVAFMYDSVTGRGDGKASRPLRMAQPSAGAQRGFHAPLKPGTEVIITCVNGDPDRPIIAGAVPNPQTPSPVTAANAEKSIWTTNVNTMAIDDDKPRAKLSVNGEDHVFQVGEPNGPEFGMLTATIGNLSSMANGAQTAVSKTLGAYHEWKTSLTGKDIIDIAGVPTPWSAWKKLEALVEGALGFVKGASQLAGGPQKWAIEHATDAKKEAEDGLKDTKKKSAEDLKLDTARRQKTNPDGTTRLETEDEALDRALADYTKANGAPPKDVTDAYKKVTDAESELKGLNDWWEETWLNVETGKTGEVIKDVESIVAGVKAIGEMKKLYSDIHEMIHGAAQKAGFIYMAAAQKHSGIITRNSGERHTTDVGTFGSHYNIQGATDSVGIQGQKNAFVYGSKHAGLSSPAETAVMGGKQLHLKSRLLIESAAKTVVTTAKELFDVHSSGKVKIVAHTGDKSVAVPAGHTMFLHSKEGIMMDSVEKDIEITAKQSFKVKAKDTNIELTAEKGKVELMANDGPASMRAKKKALVQSLEGDITVVADKGKGTVQTSKELKLESKSGQWKTSGNIEFKVKNFTVNGSKVELG